MSAIVPSPRTGHWQPAQIYQPRTVLESLHSDAMPGAVQAALPGRCGRVLLADEMPGAGHLLDWHMDQQRLVQRRERLTECAFQG